MILKKLKIENFRGIHSLSLELDRTTVLIGENNAGKTSVLDCLYLCLGRGATRRAIPFSEYDYHLAEKDSDPTKSSPVSVHLEFREENEDEWPESIAQALPEVVQTATDGKSEIRLRFQCGFDAKTKDYSYEWNFLDLNDKPLKASTRRYLSELQQFVPIFLLSAIRDASQQFQSRSPFWSSFIRNLQLDAEKQAEIEKQIGEINKAVIDSHKPFEEVKIRLSQAASLVPLHSADCVSVEAVPARAFDMLARTQVKLAAPSGAKLPIGQHGAGTQSLAVVFLFEAFLNAKLAEAYDKDSEPLLALEEPESHLHPSAIRALWSSLEGLKGQKLIATHSGDLMSAVPLKSIRRLAKKKGTVRCYSVPAGMLTPEEERTVSYTIRSQRGSLLFARCWLLVEGQSEYWFLPEAARKEGIDFEREGIACIEFAQVKGKLSPLAKLANALGIEWHLLADGDVAGTKYVGDAKALLAGAAEADRITQIAEIDLEHALWTHGYSGEYEKAAGPNQRRSIVKTKQGDAGYPTQVIEAAIATSSKPELALALAAAVLPAGSKANPPKITQALQACKKLARGAV